MASRGIAFQFVDFISDGIVEKSGICRPMKSTSETPAGFESHVEDMGKYARDARDARRSTEPPQGIFKPWPWFGYGGFALQVWSTAYTENGEIYDFVSKQGIPGFVTVAGDRHAFWARLATKSLPPHAFLPVRPELVTGSISAPTFVQAYEHGIPKNHPCAHFISDKVLKIAAHNQPSTCCCVTASGHAWNTLRTGT